jgi:hypothetical protein
MHTPPPFIENQVLVRPAQSSRFHVHEVQMNVLTGDTALLKYSQEEEIEAAMLKGHVAELLILVRKSKL